MANRSGFPRVPDDGNDWPQLDTAGAHEIGYQRTDYYHIHNGGARRILPRDLYSVLAHVQSEYGRECAGIDNSGRYMAGWCVGEVEPVDELEAWLVSH